MENPEGIPLRRPFDPAAHELDASFRLTKFADLKGWGCKVPQEALEKLLEGLQQDSNAQESEQSHFQYIAAAPRIGKLAKIFKAHYFVDFFVVDNVSIPTVVFGVLNVCHVYLFV